MNIALINSNDQNNKENSDFYKGETKKYEEYTSNLYLTVLISTASSRHPPCPYNVVTALVHHTRNTNRNQNFPVKL